ncbi:hypothetical protein [Cryobacterium sp.]|uniref:hypothetical protein n=1 Tax=Cryobacterium sp. TaxID=1926290 RepID=UPI00262DB8BB|nr:hypothetical protein [Cryobacterium sp.]MCU1445670.1 hypothetical protein [Cryobacterium sp.]
MIGFGDAPETSCSRAGCREGAAWRLDWRNPRIHAEDRRKTWLACDEHVEFLSDFLRTRDFPLTVSAIRPTQPEPA